MERAHIAQQNRGDTTVSDEQGQGSKRKKTGLTRLEPVQRGNQRQQRPPRQEPPRQEPPTLHPLGPGETPQYRGLGRVALVLVQGRRRRAAFLAALSRMHDLSRGVAVEAPIDGPGGGGTGTFPLTLTPPDPATPERFYEALRGTLAAARLGPARATLLVGDGRVFVPYADPAAPHGYDVRGDPPPQGRVLLTPHQTHTLPEPQLQPLRDALLEVPLRPDHQPEPSLTLAVLTDRRLAPLVAGYVQRHGLAYGVRFVEWLRDSQTRQAALFDLVTADAVRPIPVFVRDFLARLPRTQLLTDALDGVSLEDEPAQRVLVAHGWQTPLFLPNVQGALPSPGVVILGRDEWGTAVIESPPPRQTMQHLTTIDVSAPARTAPGAAANGQLRLQLALAHDGSTGSPVHGLLLDERALARLRRMVRRLPRPLFERVQIALGDGVAVLVASTEHDYIEGLPLGQPLTRSEPPDLLLPRGMSLRPTLPLDLLVPALAMPPDTLTVLTRTQRYDIPQSALHPLGSLLALDYPAQRLAIAIRPIELSLDLSDLLSEPPQPAPAEKIPPKPAPEPPPKSGFLDRMRQVVQSVPTGGGPFPQELRERAVQLEQAGDYLTAGIFYSYLQDEKRAAACFERLARGGSA